MALLGFNPLTPMTLDINLAADQPHPEAVEFLPYHQILDQAALDAVREAQVQLVCQMDQGRSGQEFQVGDSVWLSSE